MISRTSLAITLVAIAAGIGSYQATLQHRTATAPVVAVNDSATEALMNFLGIAGQQRQEVAQDDPGFAVDLARLRAELKTSRDALAAALEDAATPDAQILVRVEAVITAESALERRVAKYLLTVRPHLTSEQQRKLFGLCAEEVRQGGGRQWRGGAGPGGAGPGMPGQGRGPGPHGRGRGGGWRNQEPASRSS